MRKLLSILVYFSAFIATCYTQHVSGRTLDSILETIQQSNIQQVQEVSSSNSNSLQASFDFFDTFFQATYRGDKSYFYFGHTDHFWIREHAETLDYHIEFSNYESIGKFPTIDRCTLFYRRQKKNVSIDIIPSMKYEDGITSFDLHAAVPNSVITKGAHLIECEYIAPSKGEARIEVQLHQTIEGSRNPNIIDEPAVSLTTKLHFWSKLEAASGMEILPENRLDFAQNINFVPDTLPINPKVKNPQSIHKLTLGSLSKGYKNGETFSIAFVGYVAMHAQGTSIPRAFKCTISQRRPEGSTSEFTVFTRYLSLGVNHSLKTKSTRLLNPRLHFKTNDAEDLEYFANSSLIISCPDLFIYQRTEELNPHQFINHHIIAYDSGSQEPPHAKYAHYYCMDYPCTIEKITTPRNDHPDGEESDEEDIQRKKFSQLVIGITFGIIAFFVICVGGFMLFKSIMSERARKYAENNISLNSVDSTMTTNTTNDYQRM